MLAFLVGVLLAIACLAVVSLPFLRKRSAPHGDAVLNEAGRDLQAWATQEIRALEAERAVGEVTEEEFSARREEVRLAAARILRDQDRASHQGPLADEALEAEVLAIRRSRAGVTLCPQCQSPLLAGSQGCPRCGFELQVPTQPPTAPADEQQ